ncbi:MAG: hypothetical protein KF902_06340 [Phycisphaeraceae bacterium]|nr:hypothetical protein [Phycisphaeraceae bacterium]QYK48988.1 MAG: hypothetical protein KF838_03845 [Phycisphaeraceae bacterium]
MTTTTPDLSSPEFDPRDAVLEAALALLEARAAHMLTVDEWVGLARAVAKCQGIQTVGYLTDRDLDQVVEDEVDWDTERDGPLPEAESL